MTSTSTSRAAERATCSRFAAGLYSLHCINAKPALCQSLLSCWQGIPSLSGFQDLAEAFETGDADKFTDSISEFDSMTRLDQWKTGLLLRAKKRIQARDEEDEEDLT